MLNLLLANSFVWKGGWTFWLVIAITAVILLGYFAIFLLKKYSGKNLLKQYTIATVSAVALSTLAILMYGFYQASWQFWLALGLVVAAIVGYAIAYSVKKCADKDVFKYYGFGMGILTALSLVAIVVYSLYKGAVDGEMTASTLAWVLSGIVIVVLIGIVTVCLLNFKKENNNNTVALVYAAVCIAMSFALSYIRFLKMPNGGSITLASLLPIAIYSYIFGARKGIVCCFIYGILQMIQDPWFVHPMQILLDYPLAFMLVGLSGIFKSVLKKYPSLAIALGLLCGVVARYICHVLSGSIYFASSAPDGMNVWIYSLGYNSVVFVDGAIAIFGAAMLLLSKNILREFARINGKYTNASSKLVLDIQSNDSREADEGLANDDGHLANNDNTNNLE